MKHIKKWHFPMPCTFFCVNIHIKKFEILKLCFNVCGIGGVSLLVEGPKWGFLLY